MRSGEKGVTSMTLQIRKFAELTLPELYRLLQARIVVFVVEQDCPYQELDGLDEDAVHVWLEDGDGVAAYLRILPPGTESEHPAIGRVITTRRGEGLGRRIFEEGLRVARELYGPVPLYLEAQTHAAGFYEKFGFRIISPEFMMDGIPHVRMLLNGP